MPRLNRLPIRAKLLGGFAVVVVVLLFAVVQGVAGIGRVSDTVRTGPPVIGVKAPT